MLVRKFYVHIKPTPGLTVMTEASDKYQKTLKDCKLPPKITIHASSYPILGFP